LTSQLPATPWVQISIKFRSLQLRQDLASEKVANVSRLDASSTLLLDRNLAHHYNRLGETRQQSEHLTTEPSHKPINPVEASYQKRSFETSLRPLVIRPIGVAAFPPVKRFLIPAGRLL
jgi:hypothetical protein